jgi:hypothetical protein
MFRSFPIAGITLFALLVSGCGAPPQIGPEKDALKAVEALYTAVSLRDETLVADCVARLKTLHDGGKLPDAAFRSLEAIVEETKAGDWEPSQERLIRFMEGQRR